MLNKTHSCKRCGAGISDDPDLRAAHDRDCEERYARLYPNRARQSRKQRELKERRRVSRGVALSERLAASDTATGAPAVTAPFALVRQAWHMTGLGQQRLTTAIRANPNRTPVQYFGELESLGKRLMNVAVDLDGETIWTLVGQIAVLAVATDAAEVFAAELREARARAQLAAVREAADQEAQRDQAAADAYVPPPLDVRGWVRA